MAKFWGKARKKYGNHGKCVFLLAVALFQIISIAAVIPLSGRTAAVNQKSQPASTNLSMKDLKDCSSSSGQSQHNVQTPQPVQDSLDRNQSPQILRAGGQEFIGDGNDFEVTEQYTGINSGQLNTSNTAQTSSYSDSFFAPAATNYNYDSGTWTMSNVKAAPDWRIIDYTASPDTSFTSKNATGILNRHNEVAMSFQIPMNFANITHCSVYLLGFSSPQLSAYVINSTGVSDPGGDPSTNAADKLTTASYAPSSHAGWLTLKFGDNVTLRRGRKYYLVLNDTQAPVNNEATYWAWGLSDETGGSTGDLYWRIGSVTEHHTSSSWGSPQTGLDLVMSIALVQVVDMDGSSIRDFSTTPGLADLKYGAINLETAGDITDTQMSDVDTHSFTSNTSVTFTIDWVRNFTYNNGNPYSANSKFLAKNSTDTSWNITFASNAIAGISYPIRNHTLYLTHTDDLATDWSLTTVYNGSSIYGSSSPEVLYANGNPYLIVNASAGDDSDSWRVVFTSPNYISSLTLVDAATTITRGTRTIPAEYRSENITVSSEFRSNTKVSGTSLYNITAAFPDTSENVIPGHDRLPASPGPSTVDRQVNLTHGFFSPNGTYNFTVLYWNGTQAGLYSRPLIVLTSTDLAEIDVSTPLFTGETVNITVTFNDTSDNNNPIGITSASLAADADWDGSGPIAMTEASGMSGVYYVNITVPAVVGLGSVSITAEKWYYQNHTSSPLIVNIEYQERTVLENLAFSMDVDSDLYYTDAFNITIDLHNATGVSHIVPDAQIASHSDYSGADNAEFTPFANGTRFWLEVNTSLLSVSGTFWLNVTFQKLYFQSQISATETFTIRVNPTELSTYSYANKTVANTVYYHPTQRHTFFIEWHDLNHNPGMINDTDVQINSSKVIRVANSTLGGHSFEFLPDIVGRSSENTIQITLDQEGYTPLIYIIAFDVQLNPTAWDDYGPANDTTVYFDQNITLWMAWNDSTHAEIVTGAALTHDGGKWIQAKSEVSGNYSVVWHLNYTNRLPLPQTWSLNVTLAKYGYEPLSLIFEINLQKSPTASTPQWPSSTTIQLNYTDSFSFWAQWYDTDGTQASSTSILIYDSDTPLIGGNASVTFNATLSHAATGNHTFIFNEGGTTLPGLYLAQITFGNGTHSDAVFELWFLVLALPTKSPVTQVAFPTSAYSGDSITGQFYWEDLYSSEPIIDGQIVAFWNGTVANNVQVTSATAGVYSIAVDTGEIDWAPNYNLTLEFWKGGYVNQSVVVLIDIEGLVAELEVSADDALVRGEGFVIEAYLYYNSITGYRLLQNGGFPIEGESVEFTISVSFNNGTNQTFVDSRQTNAQGIATFALSPEETEDIASLFGIAVSYAGSGRYRSQSFTMDPSLLPPVRSPTEDIPLTEELWEFIQDNLLYISAGGILSLAMLAVSGQRLRVYRRKKRRRQAIINSLGEIRTMRSIIVRHRDGIRLFSQSVFGSDEGRDDAIAGMSAAIAAFLQEVAADATRMGDSATAASTEFVRMQQRGLHMLQRNGKFTVVIIISEAPLGTFTENNLRTLQKTIEERFAPELEDFFSNDQIPEEDVAAMVNQHLYVGLLGAIQICREKLKAEEKKLSAIEKRIVRELRGIITSVAGEPIFYLDSYTSHLQNRKISTASAAKFILKGYKIGIFEAVSHEELLRRQREDTGK